MGHAMAMGTPMAMGSAMAIGFPMAMKFPMTIRLPAVSRYTRHRQGEKLSSQKKMNSINHDMKVLIKTDPTCSTTIATTDYNYRRN